MRQIRTPVVLLSAGIALVFASFGLEKFFHPLIWIGWIPRWMGGFLGIPAHIWLQVLGVLEIAIAVMLVTQLRNIQRIASLAAGAYIAGVLTQTGWNDIAARDIAILTSALALFFLLREE